MSPPQSALAPPEFAGAFAWLRARLAARFEPQAQVSSVPFRPPAPLHALAQKFSLGPFEQQLVLLCLFAESDPRLGEVFAAGQHDGAKPYPTLGLAGLIFDAPSVAALAEDAPLRRWRLIEIDSQDFCAFAARQIRLAPRVLQALSADGDVRRDLPAGLSKLELSAPTRADAPPLLLRRAFAANAVVVISGAEGAASRQMASDLAAPTGLEVLQLRLEDLPETLLEGAEYSALVEREARLAPFCLLVTALRRDAVTPGQMATAIRLIERLEVPTVVDIELDRSLVSRAILRWEPPETDFADRRAAWVEALGDGASEAAEQLASTFRMAPDEITAIGAACRSEDLAETTSRASEACRQLSRPKLDPLARRVVSRARLTDVVLPALQASQLAQFVQDVRHARLVRQTWGFADLSRRGLGFSALFAGESGTGKTFAAEAIANELAFDLRRVDLASVVSKFIGETEKNLKALFDAAERGGIVLFFDESRRAFRPAHRGQGQPRPLRQYRNQLFAATD